MSEADASSGTAAYDWAGSNGARWAAKADRMERQLEPVNAVLFAAAAPEPGARVLDVGCGGGVTTCLAAELVGASPGGAVTGLDISSELLELARDRADPDLPITWQLGDAQQLDLSAGHYDAVISRFGVMFFAEPATAFANLRTAARPGGRLILAVWPRRERVELMQLLVDVALDASARHGQALVPPEPDEGPFSLGDPDHTRSLLVGAGWDAVTITDHDLVLYSGGVGPIDEVAPASLDMGAMRAMLDQASPAVADAVRAAVTDELARRHDGTGVPLGATISIVEARNPG